MPSTELQLTEVSGAEAVAPATPAEAEVVKGSNGVMTVQVGVLGVWGCWDMPVYCVEGVEHAF